MIYTSTYSFTRLSFLFCWLAILLALPTVSAQAPGGISTNLKLWLKADVSVTPATQGAAVTSWGDQSGAGNNATYSTPIFAQTVVNPTYQLNALNFNPTIRFPGTSNTNFASIGGTLTPAITSNNISAYAVFLMNSTASGGSGRAFIISQTPTSSDWQSPSNSGIISRSSASNLSSYRNNVQGPTLTYPTGQAIVFSSHFTAANQWTAEMNGNAFTSVTYTTAALNSGYYRLGTSTYSSNDWFNGDIAEVILYNSDQSSQPSHNQIESYLALKYGIHKVGSYANSSGTTVWDATANVAYHNDIFGIGQDDATGLLQVQSNSLNTGSGDGTGQSGKGNIVISNPSSLANNGFLIIGHDTGLLTEIDVNLAGHLTKGMQRLWKVQSTGNPGTVTLTYDKTGLTYTGLTASDYTILVDPTGTGNLNNDLVKQYPASTIVGDKISFNTVNLPTGAVFTIQTSFSAVTPTVQATNVTFTGTTATTTTANWINGNGALREIFILAGSTGSPAPVNNITYTANPVFGTGTQIGTTGWYSAYKGTGSNVTISGLAPATNYTVMAVEYNGIPGSEIYLSTVSTGNPEAVTTPNNVATLSNLSISEGTLNPVFATGTTSYTATVPNIITSLTLTPTTTDVNATVTVNNVTVTSGSASGAIALNVGPNIITTVVTAQDGTTIGTYTVTITRTEPTIVTTGTLTAQTAIYGTPSAYGTFNISGSDMAEGILVTPPVEFEVSADNIVFTNSITIGAAGIIPSTPVYIRLKGTIPVGNYSGDIVLTSSNAATVNVATVSSEVTKATLTITTENKTKIYGSVNPALTVTYTGFVNGDTVASLSLAPIIGTAATTASQVGSYPITASGATSDNYTFAYIDGNLTVTPVVLTITADNQTKTYGSVNPALTANYTGFVNGDTAASLTTLPILSTTADSTSPVGTYPITASGAVDANYTFTYVDGTLTVTPAILTITADAQTKTYGSANPALTASYVGFVNGDTAASLTTPPTIATTADTASPVGTYSITASGAVDANYTFNYVDGTLTVTPVVLTITADNQSKTYGDVNPTLTASYTGFVNGDTVASLTTLPILSTTADSTSPVGTYPITASGAVDANYTFTYVDATLTVTPAILTITADNQTKVYGSANPALTASYVGFVNGDTAASLTTLPILSTTADSTSPVGSYPITSSGATSDNYTFAYVDGNLTITAAVLTVTADNQTKTYGSVNPTLTASYSGFVNGDTAASLTTLPILSTTADATSPVGSYPITASGATSDNYTFAYVDGNLTITAAVLTVTADAQTKTYGSVNPTLTASYSGFVNGDTEASLTTLPILSTTADSTSPVGTYPITANGAVDANYTFAYVDGNLTITAAVLTVTADNQTKVYGSANSTLTASYSGFVNGDTSASLTTLPILSTTADSTSPVGSYSITSSGATSDNYTFAYVDGNLTITAAVLTVTADNHTKTYGSANPTLTASYTGFVNGDTAASLTTLPILSTTADATSPVGSYPITANGAVDSNYTFAYVDGNLTITPAVLTVTADAQTKTYGSANPTLTASYSGFVNGDTSASLTTPPTISTIADATSPIGTYPITASGATSDNYTFAYVDGNLTITAAVLTVTADNQTKTYGSANPALTVSYTGFVNGDTSASLTTLPILSTTADSTSPVGTYPITVSGAASANYTFSYVDGTLTVTPVVLTITADNQSKIYGDVNPTLTASYSGFVNGDTAASLTTLPILSTTADSTSPVGSYPITASGAVDANYTFAYVDGNLTITAAVLTVTADTQTKTYGSANPALTASYSGFVNGDTSASLTTPPTISTTADAKSPVGSYSITASGAASANYTFSYVDGTLTVTPVVLTITADNQSKIYGDVNPTLTASYSGFVNGDTAASLTTLPTIATTADATSPVGSYPITASGATSDNYTFAYIDGNLNITAAVLTITADNYTKTYGSVNPALTASYSGFVNGDTSASLTTLPILSTTADATSPVGSYPITASGATSDNYTFAYVDGNLTITGVVLTVTADNQTKTYGSANPALTASYSGFVNGDTSASLTTPPTIATTADATSPVGSYPITASGATSDNYTFAYVDGNLTITAAVLTITADNQTKTYGSANPALTASYSGFVNGDTSASLTTLPTISTIADATSPVGSYSITASGATSDNYTFAYVDGNLTITAAVLTVTADNQTKTYGSANPALTASYSGFVNGDTSASLTTLPILSTTADSTSPIGTYPITASGVTSDNYTFAYVDGNLTITAAVLTITADNQTKTYGSANPTLTASYSGFVNGDTSASLTTLPTIATTADATSPVGSYPITASGATSDNYTFAYVDGNLTIIPAVLTVTADNQTKTYGSVNPTLTASYSGFVNGDTSASLTTLPILTTTADTASPVGSYPITASGATSDNYTFAYVDGNLTITPAVLTVTADNQTKTYGSVNPVLAASYSGFVNGETSASLTTLPILSTTADTASAVGTYPITASGATSDNYTFAYVDGTLTVTKALITISADDKAKAYGTANPTLTATYLGFVNGEDETDLTALATITTTADLTSVVGTYPITVNGALSSNYDFTYVNGTLTVTSGAILTITVNNQTKIYGEINPAFTVSYSGFVNGDTEANLTTQPIVSTTAIQSSPVGIYTTIASGASATNYTIIYVNGTLDVIPANLTITANYQSKTYGSANPTLTASYTGFVNGDTAASLATPPTITTTADVSSPVGTYPITASGATSANYTFNYVDGTLTVTPVALTITADNQTKTYGDVNPTLTVSYAGFVNGDTSASLTTLPTITTIADATSPVGTYPITASGAASANYTFSYVDGTLTVTPVVLTITADNQSKIYGDVNPTLTVSYTGFVNGDTAASLTTPPTITTIADATSPVGTYSITPIGATSANYTFSYVNGTLTVTPVVLTITADNQSKIYGDVNPTLTVSYSGFVNGDTAASLTTPPTISTTADATSPVGTYPITASGATSGNYTFSYVDGTLTVTPVVLTITADNQSKIYGDANPTLTVNYAGFVNGDTAASLTTLPTITTTADATSPVGTYPITASGATSANYTFNYVVGTLTVTPVALTITADNQTKTYGDVNPALTVSYTGFVNGDTAASLTTLPTITTTADATSPVGTYPIIASGATSANYTFNYVDGTLTVTPVALTITADNQTKTYGDVNPTLTVSYAGFVNGDTAASLTTPPTITTTADATSPVGIYPITASGAISTNYTISYVDGTLNVTSAALLTIIADNKTKVYGEVNPVLTVTYVGFVNGDTETSLTTLPTITTTAVTGSPVGTYPITANGAATLNYTITYVPGILTVTPANLIITANNQSKVYGDLNPTLTAAYTGFVNGDTEANLTTAPVITTVADATSPAGTYPIAVSGAVDSNYTISYIDGTLTVTPAILTITADNQSKVYGDLNPPLTASYSGFVNGDTSASLTTPATITTTANATSPIGSYPIAVSGAINPNYTISYIDGNLIVNAAILTVTADNQTKLYGDLNPVLTANITGFVNGDTEASLTTAPTITTTAVTTSPIGTYPITASGATSANYTFNYVDGILTVIPVVLTITADNKGKIYGDANPTLTVSYAGFVNGDTAASLTTPATITTTANATSPVGTYPITASGAVDSNYIISYIDGNLAITTATLIISVNNQTKVYGEVNPSLTASYTGFVNGDNVASFTTPPAITTTAVTGSIVGTYPITATGAINPNYTISYVDASLTITTAPLTITADNKTRVFGEPNPTLTASYTGFVNGDTVASLTSPVIIATTANSASPAGVYAITVSSAANSNYTITYVNGILTVTAFSDVNLASLTINNGVLNPAFSSNVVSYNATVESNISSETITAVANDPLATITINGVAVQSGTPHTISLLAGTNAAVIKVVGEDGVTTKTYTINIVRESAAIATLSNLAISNAILNPVFESDITNYKSVVKYNVNSVTITPTVTDLGSKVTVNGLPVASGASSTAIILIAGDNTIETIVTAQDGITKETYTIVVHKAVSPESLVVTNILSPNGDGKNDFWEIQDILLYPNNKVTVFDRAGRIIYSKSGYSNEWEGSYSGSPLNNDTYYYLIELGDDIPRIKGFISIIRD
ncbi:MBG domain-containing protein [Flavobacterium sp. FlaQc-47]|uniref:MBG domain-containing protein n=1 Tax=Flavobacterium sp. FlaQc-47 TaxID=3374180 RepID=UPI003756E8EE